MAKECCNANSGACAPVDYHRLDRVPSFTYKKIVQLHEEYCTIREEIDKQKGLISPIRAIVFDFNKSFDSRHRHMYELVNTLINIQFKISNDKFDINHISVDMEDTTFMNRSSIVGYCVAVPDPEYPECCYKVGISYCRPDDFYHFNREFGIIQAYKHAQDFNSCSDPNPRGPNRKLITTNRRNSIFYIWPNSYNKQINDFCNRADKYFKVNKEEIK